jgi:hypothetical protein
MLVSQDAHGTVNFWPAAPVYAIPKSKPVQSGMVTTFFAIGILEFFRRRVKAND